MPTGNEVKGRAHCQGRITFTGRNPQVSQSHNGGAFQRYAALIVEARHRYVPPRMFRLRPAGAPRGSFTGPFG